MKEKTINKNSEEKRGRDDWLQAALTTLVREGIDNVRVERLARDLGVTKGSFYWHFKNRNDLLEQILSYWSSEMNAAVFQKIADLDSDLESKMFALMREIILKQRGRFDPAIRTWSKKDKAVAEMVRSIDGQRLAFLSGLLHEAGFDNTDANTRAQLLYGYMVGEPSVLHHVDKAEQLENLQRMIKVITAGV